MASVQPGGGAVHLVVPPDQDGLRLDQVLALLVAQLSRSQAQRLIKEGAVSLGGRVTTRPGTLVRAGTPASVVLSPAVPAQIVPQPLPIDVIYEDSWFLVVDKPPGMVVHPAAGHAEGTLVNALLHHVGDLSGIGGDLRPGIVHRLDKGTSGLMVVAKHDRAHEALARQFHDRAVEKEYVALVWGTVVAGRRIEDPIGRDPGDRKKMSTRARRARTAVTRITGAETLAGVTLARIAIATGRTHQIRVHLTSIGHPVVGDALYGGVHRRVPPHLKAVTRLERPFLHAARLAFAHPEDGRPLSFESPLPVDLQAVLDDLKAAGRAASCRARP